MSSSTPSQTLTAGHWSAQLSDRGALSRVSWNGIEILRGLSVVVRTNTWLTADPSTQMRVHTDDSGFQVTVSARNVAEGVDFSWEADISATDGGEFCFSFRGHSAGITSTNRIGLVALHSLNWAGSPCDLGHPDGTTETTRYPALVAPHQPMKDISQLTQDLDATHILRMSFEGEIFEMEDQRNWTDASFKTYSRPLDWPFPYELLDGEEVSQTIQLAVESRNGLALAPRTNGGAATSAPSTIIDLPDASALADWPRIGVGLRPGSDFTELDAVWEDISPRHIRIDVVCDGSELCGERDLTQAFSRNLPVELAIHVGEDADGALTRLAELLASHAPESVFVFDLLSPSTTPRVMAAVGRTLQPVLPPGTRLYVGTDDNFTELNRNRVLPSGLGADGVSFSLNPQIHDSSERAILETAEAIPAIIDTARDFSSPAAIAISPLVFKARRNIYAPGRTINRLGRDEDYVDERHGGMFSAVWLISTVHALVHSRVERMTLGEIVGPSGLITAHQVATKTRSPLAELVRWLTVQEKGAPVGLDSAGEIVGLLGADASGVSCVVANTSNRPATVTVQGPFGLVKKTLPPQSYETVR